jgi:tRNA(Leu) C34 or U34 (ribose-2'-O)-methylase TrmL
MNKRGYFGIGCFEPKRHENIGTLWRHAYVYEADFIFTIGKRYQKQASDTSSAPRHIPLYHYEDMDDFWKHIPDDCVVVPVEQGQRHVLLPYFTHPERAVYLLGSEDHGLPEEIFKDYLPLEIPTPQRISMNVATAGTIVMYDRHVKSLTLS